MVSADLLREARLRSGVTQTELGRRIGRSQSQIARWERGDVKPSFETLRELIRACGLELTFGLANYDDSYDEFITASLARRPAERVARAVQATQVFRDWRERLEAARGG